MAIEVAKYQFQSWARRGIAAHIAEPDTLGQPGAALPPGERASVPIGVSINGAPQPAKSFELVGPGDIQGVMREMVVRTEPRHWITSFEPNYLAFVEFYDEDFPWRYTPARPQGENLRPWIVLAVLKADEFGRDDRRVPLPVVTVRRPQALPPADATWLFAHVHTEQDIPGSELSNLEQYLRNLREAVAGDPDKIYSRLLSPRHLEPDQTYHAFVVPAFEVGRLAGLGRPTSGVPAQQPAWDSTTTGLELPVYYDWEFRTGERENFESLVRLLKPEVLSERVGIRDMDCSRPGFVRVDDRGIPRPVPAGGSVGLPAAAPAVQGLEGALKTDRTRPKPATYTPNAFQDELQVLVNLPDTVHTDPTVTPGPAGEDDDFLKDPVVSVPFYGQNHARQRKTDTVTLDVSTGASGWYHELNRDPRNRVPAGLGTVVVQKGQERFVQKAWQQVEAVYEANRKIRLAQFALQVSTRYHVQVFSRLGAGALLALTRPVHAKVLGSPTTVFDQIQGSRLVAPVLGAAFRRLVRPAGKLRHRLAAHAGGFEHAALIAAVNEGRVSPAPPRAVPPGLPSVDGLAEAVRGRFQGPVLRWLIANRRWLPALLLLALAAIGWLTGAWWLVIVAVPAAAGAAGVLYLAADRGETSDLLTDPERAARAVAAVAPRPSFRVVLDEPASPPSGGAPPAPPPPEPAPGGATGAPADSAEAAAFRRATIDLQQRLQIRAPAPVERGAFDLERASATLIRAIDPRVSFPRRLSALVRIPGRSLSRPEDLVDAMAHPDIDDAMYAPLRDINKELLVPNLQLIPPNSISLLETNPPFIEAYMVGLNHEMGRELLWREYPTDLRGSYFRQFWEVKGVSNPDTPADAERRKDVTRLHTWPASSPLGSHRPPPDPRADVPAGGKHVVLVIRGELLKRYPNTVIYAQKAIGDGQGNRVLRETDLTPEQFDTELKFPLFRAEIDPDLRCFGFDLTTDQARGTAPSRDFPGDTRGWFFVVQEVPGEPRFGMDIAYQATQDADANPLNDPRDTWDNLAWNLFGAAEPAFVPRAPAPAFPRPDAKEIAAHPWGSNAAHMAYALFQSPAMVAVHADEMVIETPAVPA